MGAAHIGAEAEIIISVEAIRHLAVWRENIAHMSSLLEARKT